MSSVFDDDVNVCGSLFPTKFPSEALKRTKTVEAVGKRESKKDDGWRN